MRVACLVGFLLLTGVLCLSCSPSCSETGGNESGRSTWSLVEDISTLPLGKTQTFLSEVLHETPNSILKLDEASRLSRYCRDTMDLRINGFFWVILDQHSGEILHFHDEWPEPSREEKARAVHRSADDVFAMASKALAVLGQPQDRSQYEVRPVLEDSERLEDTRFGEWEIVRNYTYNGLPCRGRVSTLYVFPQEFSVHVKGFWNFPLVTPEDEPKRPIGRKRAIRLAETWLIYERPWQFISARIDSDAASRTVKVIALPNDCFSLRKKDPDCRGVNSKYCWEVPFTWKEPSCGLEPGLASWNGVLWVSLRKGQVIGGEMRY